MFYMSKKDEKSYVKKQLLGSQSYTRARRDFMNALLDDEKHYTRAQAAECLEKHLKKEVK